MRCSTRIDLKDSTINICPTNSLVPVCKRKREKLRISEESISSLLFKEKKKTFANEIQKISANSLSYAHCMVKYGI